ncbi:MAG: CNNM domain-containing protein, partial [bacterium]
MDSIAIIQAFILVVLLLLSSFFSSSETALTTVNLIRIGVLAEEGDKRAKMVLTVTENRSKMLTTILIGNNIVNIAVTSLTTVFVIRLFGDVAIGIASGILTLLVLIFGEITPKSIAASKSEEL